MSGVIKTAAGNTQKQAGIMSKAFKGIGGVAKTAIKGATVALAGLGVGIVATARLAAIQEDAEAKLAATVKSMSAETWTSVDALKAHASELQGNSKFGDEAIIAMQGVLLTFGNVKDVVGEGNDIFSQSTQLILDMSEKLGTDLQSSSIQVGKALNDPIKGVTALTRVGVSFTEQQKDQIKELQNSGDLLGAQKVILGELEKQFGGTAAAAAEAGTGPFVQFKNIMGDIGEAIGRITLPVLQDLAKWASGKGQSILKWFESDVAQSWIKDIQDGVKAVVDKFIGWAAYLKGEFKSNMDKGMTPVQAAIDMVKDLAEKLMGMVPDGVKGNVSGLATAFTILGGPLTLIVRELLPALKPVFDAIIPPLAEMANELAPALADVLAILAETAIPIIVDALGVLAEVLKEHPDFIYALIGAFVAFKTVMLVQMVAGLIPTIIGAWGKLQAVFLANPWVFLITAIVALAILIYNNWDAIVAFLKGVWDWLKAAGAAAFDAVADKIEKVLGFLKGLFLNWTGPGLIIKHWDTIKAATTAVKDWIVDTWTAIFDWFKSAPGKMASAARGLFDGIRDAFKAAINWIIDKWNGLKFSLPSFSMFGSTIGGGTISTPNIPRLHEGGVYEAPPGRREGLALLEDGETVTPAGAGSVTHQWYITQPMDPTAVFETAAWKLRTAGV